MPKLSLTEFVDVVSAQGTPKTNRIKVIKNKPAYHPAMDFYKRIRDGIVDVHESGGSRNDVKALMGLVTDRKKAAHYQTLVDGYCRWWGRKKIAWNGTVRDVFSANNVDVQVNPELGVSFDGVDYLIKMYFKDEPLSPYRVSVITHLMHNSLLNQVPANTVMAVLDVRKARLHKPKSAGGPVLSATLLGELAYINSVWPMV